MENGKPLPVHPRAGWERLGVHDDGGRGPRSPLRPEVQEGLGPDSQSPRQRELLNCKNSVS